MERKLASVQRIVELKHIEGADSIEAARVNGWWVVVKLGEFNVGDLCIYLEIDSWVPYELAPFLSRGKEPREFDGVKGERLRTVKLRGQLSQGLILPFVGDGAEGDDLTEAMGIKKWEKPTPACLSGQMKGNFPSFIPKTDQERVQNLPEVFDDVQSEYEVTVKLDGSSMTVYWHEGVFGVCSRNVDLKMDQEGNTFVDTAKRVFDSCDFSGLAIQGELMGPGIQGNREKLSSHEFFVFDIWVIPEQRYYTPDERREFCKVMGLQEVPYLETVRLSNMDLESLLQYAEGPSLNNPVREGVVFKRRDGKFSFKAISNKFLLGDE